MLSVSDMESAPLSKFVRDDISFPLHFDNVSEDFQDLKNTIARVIEINLDLLDEVPLPKHFNREEMIDFFKRQVKSDLEKDVLFEKSVELRKYSRNMYEAMDSYFGQVFHYYEQRQKRLSLELFGISKMFLNSDLPTLFVTTIENSILAEKDYIGIFVRKIRQERSSLLRYRNDRQKFRRVCDSHNRWANRFHERLDTMESGHVKLIWYVDLSNSRSYDEIFKEKFIKTNLLDKEILSAFINSLINQVHECEKLNASMTESCSFLPFETDGGTRTIRKIMQILEQ